MGDPGRSHRGAAHISCNWRRCPAAAVKALRFGNDAPWAPYCATHADRVVELSDDLPASMAPEVEDW